MIRTEIGKALGAIERRLAPGAPVILIYHRIGDARADPWGITTDPEVFQSQLEALQSVRRVVSLDELMAAARERRRRPDRPLAAITFDDGYRDVLTTAAPILEKLECPATVFIVTDLVGQARELWWDELAFIFLEDHPLPASLELSRKIGGPVRVATSSPEARSGACHRLRARLRYMPPERIEAELDVLRRWAGVERPARGRNRMMSGEEIAALRGGVLTVGAHTRRHPALPSLNYARQREEIASSRSACEAFYGAPVAHFAYPFGDFDGRSIRAAQETGFMSASTTAPGVVTGRGGPYRLPRINPGRSDGDALIAALR